jgi:hypothetical protein
MVFWDVVLCGMVDGARVLKERPNSILRAECEAFLKSVLYSKCGWF